MSPEQRCRVLLEKVVCRFRQKTLSCKLPGLFASERSVLGILLVSYKNYFCESAKCFQNHSRKALAFECIRWRRCVQHPRIPDCTTWQKFSGRVKRHHFWKWTIVPCNGADFTYAAQRRRGSLCFGMWKQRKAFEFLLHTEPFCRIRNKKNKIFRQESFTTAKDNLVAAW